MRSTFHNLETAKRSLFTQQAALSTTGNNIANSNTEGYSRQTVNMVASRPMEAVGLMRSNAPGQIGTGVEYSSITRVREQFLDAQFRNENKTYGSWSIQLDTLEKLETIVNEPSEAGLNKVIDKFWKAWHDLSESPEDITARKLVRETAAALTDAFNQTSKQLEDLKTDISENIEVKTSQINTITSTIANLNGQIIRIEGLGDNANDLRDQRDLLVDQLSKIANVNVQEAQGGYQVTLAGVNVVNGQQATEVTVDGLQDNYESGTLIGGEIHGMFRSRDVYVTDYQNQLNTLVNGLANGEITVTLPAGAVIPDGTTLNGVPYQGTVKDRTLANDLPVTVQGFNALHKLGYTMVGDQAQQAGNFFVASNGGVLTAGNIQVSADILSDESYIASSMRTTMDGTTEKVVKGNKDLALLISQFNDTKIDFSTVGGGNVQGTISDYFRSVVGQLGVQTEEAQRQADNAKLVVDQVDSRRQSVSGVSLDEEMSNMIKFQHAYNAAARVMTSVDEILDKIINGMGVVGR
ncbi:flagellar hook-associated protein FlgK [Paenibacillus turpanensis]|uniref:flagellar hook-associated protein FlgK n=1 Tax=Paenibacillus turpanensis TaxID=2689078 RepID=UPI00140776DC|nr:flagellar hook-associated protein FlgK [Paenibacillus turpanensis]